jgi:transglutaminase-like putative cysteine protease
MRRIQIEHTTRYSYEEAVTLLPHTLHLRPREGHDIRLESSKLNISPGFNIHWQRDVYGNSVAVVNFLALATELIITSEVVVEHYGEQSLTFVLAEYAQRYPFDYDPIEQVDLTPYKLSLFPQDNTILQEWIAGIYSPQASATIDTVQLLNSLNNKIANELEYRVREEPGVQSPAQTLSMGNGSCRDFATLFIELCRCCGFASRFISGYLLNEGGSGGHPSTHAWSEVYLPGSGWLGFDSTSGLMVTGDHIATAVHRHPEAIPPVAGAFVGTPKAKPKLSVEVKVIGL